MADLTKGHLDWYEVPSPPLPLREVAEACVKAPLVWCALVNMAKACHRITFKVCRSQLVNATGIQREQTISKALTVLNNAGWLLYSKRTKQTGDSWKSVVVVRLVHSIGLPAPSPEYRRQVWTRLFKGIQSSQPNNVKVMMDMATYVWVWECTMQLAYPDSLLDEARDVLADLPPARWYGLVPVSENDRPSYAVRLRDAEEK